MKKKKKQKKKVQESQKTYYGRHSQLQARSDWLNERVAAVAKWRVEFHSVFEEASALDHIGRAKTRNWLCLHCVQAQDSRRDNGSVGNYHVGHV